MTPLKRRVAAVSAPILLALSLTACGGGGGDSAADSPEDASTDDFCGVFTKFSDDADDIEDDDFDAQAGLLNDLSAEWTSIGTPEDANEDQRAGFVVVMDAWGDLEGSDLEDVSEADDSSSAGELGISADDEASAEEFLTYAGMTCADEIADTE